MSGRYELYSTDEETGKPEIQAFTDSAFIAERWQRDGGITLDTAIFDAQEAHA